MSQKRAAKQQKFQVAYKTEYGTAYQGDSRDLLGSAELIEESVDLIVTSPPFALARKKDYGNEDADEYVEWFLSFVEPFKRVLKPSGSLVIDIGGAYLQVDLSVPPTIFGSPLNSGGNLTCARSSTGTTPAKLPSPAEWVNVRRMRVKDSCNLVLWLAKDSLNTKADNRRVLKRYSASMEALLKNGYQYRQRPSNHDVSAKVMKRNDGAIPPNLLGASDDQTDLEGEIFESLFPNLLALSNTELERSLSAPVQGTRYQAAPGTLSRRFAGVLH